MYVKQLYEIKQHEEIQYYVLNGSQEKDCNVQPDFKENCKHILFVYIPYMLVIGYPTCDIQYHEAKNVH